MATFFMACSKLEVMAIYVVKSANANDIMPSVYVDKSEKIRFQNCTFKITNTCGVPLISSCITSILGVEDLGA